MLGGKTKKSTVKKKTTINSLEKMVRKEDTQIKADLHYFKGLSLMMIVLIMIVFFAFGCLFGALYLEVRMMNETTKVYMRDFYQYIVEIETIDDWQYEGYFEQTVLDPSQELPESEIE